MMKKNYLILDYVNFVGLLTKIYNIKYQDNYSVLIDENHESHRRQQDRPHREREGAAGHM